MRDTTHQWRMFSKGRMRVEACLNCGDLRLASNTNAPCSDVALSESQIVKAGYKIRTKNDNSVESAA